MTGIIKTDQLQGAQSSTITVPSGNNLTVGGTLGVTGAITGTLATAAQTNITSVGTLTSFRSTGIDDNADATAITINSSEQVGIGISPTVKLQIEESSTGDAVKIARGGNYLLIGGSGSGTQYVKGYEATVAFGNKYTGNTTFLTGDTERMRINSAGQVGIGVSAAATVFHVETSTDGTGTSGDELYIAKFYNREATNDRSYGIDIHAGSTATDQSLRVKDHDGTNEHFLIKGNGEVNISRDNIVFKTAGKGIYLGATSANAAKLLDDYEEGTWTPTLLGSSSNPTVSYNQTSASYIKIGQSVHLYGRILATSVSGGSGTALIGGLPFATSGSSRNAGTIGYISNVSLGTGYTQFGLNPDAGTSTMRLVQSGSGIGANVISVGVIANNFDLTFSHSYTV